MLASDFLTGCQREEMKPNDVAIHYVIERTIQNVIDLNIGYRLRLIGIGGSIDHKTGKEKTIRITFNLNHPLSKEACRWLIVNIAELFLSNINRDYVLRQYLPEGGFTFENIGVGIGFLTPDRGFLYHPDITFVSLRDGQISYATNDPKDKNGGYSPYKEVVYEPFEEALKIVEAQGRPSELMGTSGL